MGVPTICGLVLSGQSSAWEAGPASLGSAAQGDGHVLDQHVAMRCLGLGNTICQVSLRGRFRFEPPLGRAFSVHPAHDVGEMH